MQQGQLPSPSLQRRHLWPCTQLLQPWKAESPASLFHGDYQTAFYQTLKQITPALLKTQNHKAKQQQPRSTGRGTSLLLAGWSCQTKANNPNLGINHISLHSSISPSHSGPNSLPSCLSTQDKMRKKDVPLKDKAVSTASTAAPV